MSTPTRKLPLSGGTMTGDLILNAETASRVLTTNGSKKVAASSVTTTELGYLSGVTSAIQTQLNAKISTADLNIRIKGVLNDLTNWGQATGGPGNTAQVQAVACSADGRKVAVATFGGQIYTSTDYGRTFTARDSNRNWTSIASSADGTKLVACVRSGQIYTSTDSGVTWTARDSSRKWNSVASSADGTKLVAAEGYDGAGNIYTSTDSGVNWTARASSLIWFAVASSDDGTKLVAAAYGEKLYTSTDSGVNWTARDSNRNWGSVTSSADGTRLAAVVISGQIYTSTDSGATWTARDSSRAWLDIRSARDGERLYAGTDDAGSYFSIDAGVTWTQFTSAAGGHRLAVAADGLRVTLADWNGSTGVIYYHTPVIGVPSNYAEQTTGAGTNYTLTGSSARVDFGTTDAEVILPGAGTYLILANVQIQGDAAGAADEVRVKLRNSTDSTDIGVERSITTDIASSFEAVDLIELVTVTASKTVQIFAFNATSARGTVLAAKTAIRYVRLF